MEKIIIYYNTVIDLIKKWVIGHIMLLGSMRVYIILFPV